MTVIALEASTKSTGVAYLPEECPYETVFVDVTHRCNMACHNCYIPNRDIPDLDAGWLRTIYARLPRGRYIRLVGAEPTLRTDLPQLIRDVRDGGHHPIVLTNGLRIANRSYLRELKQAGLRVVYLSFNGGFNDDLYQAIDNLRCARVKVTALENLCAENMFISIGMILVRGLNEEAPKAVFDFCGRNRQVWEFHLRSVGPCGRYMETDPFKLPELLSLFARNASVDPSTLQIDRRTASSIDIRLRRRFRAQLTEWPDLGSRNRGRLTPEGTLEPAFEHVLVNEGNY